MKFNELSQELQELWTRGVDHSNFNEEWAKMGGVVKVYGKEAFFAKLILAIGDWGYFSKCVNKNGKPLFTFEAGFKEYDDETLSDYNIHRMAAPSECAEAGIDYVPFMGWRDIESSPKNVRILMRNEVDVGVGTYEPNLRQAQWMPLPLV
jgi:hypothetical protein